MKFLVDEMPYYKTECPFYEFGTGFCKCERDDCGHNYCEYFDMNRDPYYCMWLKENNDE